MYHSLLICQQPQSLLQIPPRGLNLQDHRRRLDNEKVAQPLLHIPPRGLNFQDHRRRLEKEKVVVILGATGAGKSRLSIELANHYLAEIINSDKMQVYQGLDIVTNKITIEESCGIPHHLLGVIDPNADFSAENFCNSASLALKSITSRKRRPIIVGGSNSFIEALVDNDHEFKSRYECCFLWVDVGISLLHPYIAERVDQMVQKGLINEVRNSFNPKSADYSKGIRRAIGVPELDRFLRDEPYLNKETRARLLKEAIDEIKNNTCVLASRQIDKIRRLKQVKGWEIHRLDATNVFKNRGKIDADQTWENLVVRPSKIIVNKFLDNSRESKFRTSIIYNDEIPIRHSAMGSVVATATH